MLIWLKRFRDHLLRCFQVEYQIRDHRSEEGLPYLRDRLFFTILKIAGPICFLVYIPSVIIAILTHKYAIAVADTLAVLAVTIVFFSGRLTLPLKKTIMAVALYLVAIVLYVYLGARGPSVVIMLCTSVLITLIFSSRAGVLTIVVNSLLYLAMMALLPLTPRGVILFNEYDLPAWLAVGGNLVAFNAMIVLSVASLVDHLQASFLKEKELQHRLRQEGEELLAAKQKAEQSDHLKSAFLANISHEIRTPMNGILGFSDLLSKADLDSASRHEYKTMIQKSSARMLNILNDIVDIAKIESGMVSMNQSCINLNEQCAAITASVNHDAKAKGIRLTFIPGMPDYRATILADVSKLNAILTNLLRNALKYTDKGEITLGYRLEAAAAAGETAAQNHGAGNGHYSAAPAAAELLFSVRDTGKGIAPGSLRAIFDRFHKVDLRPGEVREGAGLGMSISKTYVEMMGGRIWVESEPGKGSNFYFTLPYKDSTAEQTMKSQSGQSGSDQPTRKLKVLIAEDDEISRLLLQVAVKRISDKIICAKTGQEAVDACRKQRDIDLILMDIGMPELNGYEATDQIRRFNKDVIIIAQTAYSLAGDRETALAAGCNDYIAKPIVSEKLLAMIRQHFADLADS